MGISLRTFGGPGIATLLFASTAFAGVPVDGAGRVEFDQGAFHALESSGIAIVTVERELGWTGEVTVDYATSDLTATAGSDYTAVSGTLSWPNGDIADKTILIPVTIDSIAEGAEKVQLTLSNVTGGAELRPQHATARLIITDGEGNCDGGGGGNSHGSVRFVDADYSVVEGDLNAIITVERRGGNSGNVSVDYAAEAGSATAGSDFSAVDGTLSWAHGDGGLRTFAVPILGDDIEEETEDILLSLSNPTGGVSISDGDATLEILDNDAAESECTPSPTRLCLLGGRFSATIQYRTVTVGAGDGRGVPLSDKSGLFWFFDSANAEMLIKLIDGCSEPGLNAYWVFYSATTNVDFTLTVTDTATGVSRQYRNPFGLKAEPVQDVNTFTSCP